jgi:GNAT superfamily N-acetyltransferase
MFTLRASTGKDISRNFEIWRTSVLATHQFLSSTDFQAISKLVEESYLPVADLVVAVDANDLAHGFIGLTGDHVDALFVHAESRGRGIGSLLLRSFLNRRTEATVDVNEQNAAAASFYRSRGFEVRGRSAIDGEGRPYPLLHMHWKRAAAPIEVRDYRPDDLDALMEVFIRAIRDTACRDYTPAQVDAWAQPDRELWSQRRSSRPTWVAVVDEQVVGFTDLEPDGHIDMMYVHPRVAGKGVAGSLLRWAEEQAMLNGIDRLHAEVSLTARPFFERNGFEVIEPERVLRNGQHFDRFRMEKNLQRHRHSTGACET